MKKQCFHVCNDVVFYIGRNAMSLCADYIWKQFVCFFYNREVKSNPEKGFNNKIYNIVLSVIQYGKLVRD